MASLIPPDLGSGFHLIPIRDHCRVRAGAVPTARDMEAAIGEAWRYCATFEDALAEAPACAWARVDYRRTRRAARDARQRAAAAASHDAMAIQATMILRDVLRAFATCDA